MHTVYMVLGIVFGLGYLWSLFVVIMEAFEDEIWKGILALFIWFYGIYYAAVELDHERKWLVFFMYLLGFPLGIGFWTLAAMTK